MKVLPVCGSPRIGNSHTMLEAALEGAREAGAEIYDIVYPNKMDFRGCQSCMGCRKTGICVLKDDMTPVYDMLREADVWMFATPIYFDDISGQLKLFNDRHFCFAQKKMETEKKGAIIITYGDNKRDDYVTNVGKYLGYFGWAADFTHTEALAGWGLMEKEAVKEHPEFLEAARSLGKRLAGE